MKITIDWTPALEFELRELLRELRYAAAAGSVGMVEGLRRSMRYEEALIDRTVRRLREEIERTQGEVIDDRVLAACARLKDSRRLALP